MARPSKLNRVLIDEICARVRNGEPPRSAARVLGISPQTYDRWIQEAGLAVPFPLPRRSRRADRRERVRMLRALALKRRLERRVAQADAQFHAVLVGELTQCAMGRPGTVELTKVRHDDGTVVTTRSEEGRPNPTVIMWMLERRFPATWGVPSAASNQHERAAETGPSAGELVVTDPVVRQHAVALRERVSQIAAYRERERLRILAQDPGLAN
jgi:hypothetical protein